MIDSNVNVILFAYLLICVLLILFNIFYIFYADMTKRMISRSAGKWVAEIRKELEKVKEEEQISEDHINKIKEQAGTTNGLIAYSRALESLKTEEDLLYLLSKYMKGCKDAYLDLAIKCIDNDDMDKAFMAYFITSTFEAYDGKYDQVYIILKTYLVDSSIYCKENILKALYAFGDAQKLCELLLLMDTEGMYHHKKLLSDGLCAFNGDKNSLARLLWQHESEFSEHTRIAIINFIATISNEYNSDFYAKLKSSDVSVEEKLAYIRYFSKHIFAPVCRQLYTFLQTNEDTNLSIVSATALSSYPSKETVSVLKQALKSRNWYIRFNAAHSLINISTDPEFIQDILNTEDKYAKEIFVYALEEKGINVNVSIS